MEAPYESETIAEAEAEMQLENRDERIPPHRDEATRLSAEKGKRKLTKSEEEEEPSELDKAEGSDQTSSKKARLGPVQGPRTGNNNPRPQSGGPRQASIFRFSSSSSGNTVSGRDKEGARPERRGGAPKGKKEDDAKLRDQKSAKAKKRIDTLIKEGEKRKKLDKLNREGYVTEEGFEVYGRKLEQKMEEERRERKRVIAISDIRDITMTYDRIEQRLLSECGAELNGELSYFDKDKGVALLVPASLNDYEKADHSTFLLAVGKRAKVTELSLEEIAGEARPWGVIAKAADLLIEEVQANAAELGVVPRNIRRAGPVIMVEFWESRALERWATGRFETFVHGERRYWKRERSFMADGPLVRWMGYLPSHIKMNYQVERAIEEGYGAKAKVTIIKNPITNMPKACFYVRFPTAMDLARTTIYGTNKIALFGRVLKVDKLQQRGAEEEDSGL